MDGETIAALVGCIATIVGALTFVARSQAKTAEKNTAAQGSLVRELAVSHARNVEVRLGELVSASHEMVCAVRENTAAVNLLVSRFDAPPPSGGVALPAEENPTVVYLRRRKEK